MPSNQGKSFIESEHFPVALVSQASAKEKQMGGRPEYWEMIFWWTRKPLISARAIIAASLLPEKADIEKFVRAMNLDKKTPHQFNPTITDEMWPYFEGRRVLDPFAGFGSIPLEALRLGLSATAVELLPTAFVFLKCVLDYPPKYGGQLLKDVPRYGAIITDQLRKDPEIRSLYDESAVSIGSWEVKCPHCQQWTPLIGSFWLARVKNGNKGYSELAWFVAEKNSGEITFRIIDLAAENNLAKVVVDGNKVMIDSKEYKVQEANINPRSESAVCLHCNGTIRYFDPETGKHYLESKGLPRDVASRLVWYVKHALAGYYQNKEDIARYRLLIKVNVREHELSDPSLACAKIQGKIGLPSNTKTKLIMIIIIDRHLSPYCCTLFLLLSLCSAL